MNILPKNNLEFINELFFDIQEGIVIHDIEGNIVYINNSARNLLGNVNNILNIGHSFHFDVCVLNEEDITTYNPISALVNSNEKFKAKILYQISQNQYKTLIIKSFSIDNFKVILLSDLSTELENQEMKEKHNELLTKVKELEEYSRLKERAESQAIRVGLINRISTAIRDTLDINEIIKITLNETSKTLGVSKGIFASYDQQDNTFIITEEWYINNQEQSVAGKIIVPVRDVTIKNTITNHTSQTSIVPDINDFLEERNQGDLKSRLVSPVIYQNEMLGIMLFYHTSNKKEWHPEEISLVDGISAQVAAAIYQASLFKKLEEQKQELEHTLIDLKKAQTQLIQSEKMASLGKLVAGVAHEINTPIGSLNSNIDILNKYTRKFREQKRDNPQYESLFSILENINTINEEAIKRINTIVKSLKNFARLDEAELKAVDIHDGIKNSLMLINHEIKDRINVIEEYSELPHIECYPNLLNQVIMNILVNAYQSIESKGTIKITTELKDGKVQIIISDTGKGIKKEDLPKIFDPGFTTKGVGIGTGLGLSISYQIIEKHCGMIKVDSEIGKGTIFTIELPLRQGSVC